MRLTVPLKQPVPRSKGMLTTEQIMDLKRRVSLIDYLDAQGDLENDTLDGSGIRCVSPLRANATNPMSFSVGPVGDDDIELFYDFGESDEDHRTGDIFKYIMLKDGVSFKKALDTVQVFAKEHRL